MKDNLNIRPVNESDAVEWLRMRMALWSDSDETGEAAEIRRFLANSPRIPFPALNAAFVQPRPGGGLCGLVEVSIRAYVDGCQTHNVGYLEAWYVDPEYRSQGIGRMMVEAAEEWARQQGCSEMASDTDLENTNSQLAHQRLGFRETGRIVQFCKSL